MSGIPRQDESFSRFEEEPLRRRGHVVRMALFYTACFLFCGGVTLLAVYKGFVIMFFLFGIPAFATGYFMLQYLRDLNARPQSLEGEVWRKWHKGNLFVFFLPSYYINVQGKIFTITRKEYSMLLEDDLVRVKFFPNSLTVEQLERFDDSAKKFIPAASGAEAEA